MNDIIKNETFRQLKIDKISQTIQQAQLTKTVYLARCMRKRGRLRKIWKE